MRPNIVFFFTDQQRFDTLGCNGQFLNVTPNLDRFAAESTNFKCAFTPQPVCGPARSCLQTGLYATQTGCTINGIGLPTDIDTIAKRLNEAGYETAYVGKWHLATDKPSGRDYEAIAVPEIRRGGYKDYWYAADVLEDTSHGYDGFVFDKENNKVIFKGYRADCITDYAIDYIKDYDREEPFFLFLSHIEPHHQNDRNRFEGPEGSKEMFKDYVKPDDLGKGNGDWEENMPDYLGCCYALDQNFGRMIEVLKEKGMYENTIVIYTSDHGCHFRTIDEAVNEGFDDYKRNSFENTIHVPLLIKGPQFAAGADTERVVSLLDLPRTILEAAGAELTEGMQGRNLGRIQTEAVWDNSVYIQISESFLGRAVRTERYKYVIYAPDKSPLTDAVSDCYTDKYLFDLQEDPMEQKNLIGDSRYCKVLEDMRKLMHMYAEQAGEPSFVIK